MQPDPHRTPHHDTSRHDTPLHITTHHDTTPCLADRPGAPGFSGARASPHGTTPDFTSQHNTSQHNTRLTLVIPTNAANQDSIRILVNRFAELPVGGVIDFPTLRRALGFDIRTQRYLIPRAIRLFNRETGGIIESVRGVGYQRLSTNEYAGSISARRGRGRRIFQRTHVAFSQAVAKANDIIPAAVSRELAVIGLLAHMSRDSVTKKVTVSDKPSSHADVVRRTLEAFNS